MSRRYCTDEWLKTVKEIKKNYPDISLETSIMVGFPTETDDDFSKSMELVNSMLFDHVDLYSYEERPNLPSLRLGGKVPNELKEIRFERAKRKLLLNAVNKSVRKTEIGSLIQSLIDLSRYWL